MNFIIAFCIVNSLFLYANAETREIAPVDSPVRYAVVRALTDHKDVIAEYQPAIDTLSSTISLHASIAETQILSAKLDLPAKVDSAVATAKQDINIVVNHFLRELQRDALSLNTKSCLQMLNIKAHSLSTSKLEKCLSSSHIETADEMQTDMKGLQLTTNTFGSSCSESTPLTSQEALVRNCLVVKIRETSATLTGLIMGFDFELEAANIETKKCIKDSKNELRYTINSIMNKSVLC